MRTTFSFLLLILCCCSNKNTAKQNIFLKLILNAYSITLLAIAFKPDSILILRESIDTAFGKIFYIESYKVQDKYDWEYLMEDTIKLDSFSKEFKFQHKDSAQLFKKIANASIYFKNILEPLIQYPNPNKSVADSILARTTDCREVLCQKKDNYNFYACKGLDNNLFIYNDRNQLLYSYKVENNVIGIGDFFLFDVVGDTNSELILFLNGPFVRNSQGVKVRVYTIEGLKSIEL